MEMTPDMRLAVELAAHHAFNTFMKGAEFAEVQRQLPNYIEQVHEPWIQEGYYAGIRHAAEMMLANSPKELQQAQQAAETIIGECYGKSANLLLGVGKENSDLMDFLRGGSRPKA